MTSILK